jgi:nitrate reductase delta subunit
MFLSIDDNTDRREATRQIKAWTRERFRLDDAAVITAAEIACPVPGCPPLETVVIFWTDDGTRHRFKVFKPIVEATNEDIPYAWLLKALIDDGESLECC